MPELFRQAGYYTCIADASGERNGKQDYNFSYDPRELYHGISYRDRKPNQPFLHNIIFAVANSGIFPRHTRKRKRALIINSSIAARLLSLPTIRTTRSSAKTAQYIDSVNYTDIEVGRIFAFVVMMS